LYPNQNGKKKMALDNFHFNRNWQVHGKLDNWPMEFGAVVLSAFWG
jgi:hypothetical protein